MASQGDPFGGRRWSGVYVAYILRSERDGTYYYGSTRDLEKRLKEHNGGKVRYTKGHRPYVIHYVEDFVTRDEAGERERFFKSIEGYRWLREQGIIKTSSTLQGNQERWPSG